MVIKWDTVGGGGAFVELKSSRVGETVGSHIEDFSGVTRKEWENFNI